MYRIDLCLCCGNRNISTWPAMLAPFVLEYMASGTRVVVDLAYCPDCGFKFFLDRYEDSEKNTFTVSDKTKGGVNLRGQGGSKGVATSDLLKMKKLDAPVKEAYGQANPLKIPAVPKIGTVR